jgi:hypothetical protein
MPPSRLVFSLEINQLCNNVTWFGDEVDYVIHGRKASINRGAGAFFTNLKSFFLTPNSAKPTQGVWCVPQENRPCSCLKERDEES